MANIDLQITLIPQTPEPVALLPPLVPAGLVAVLLIMISDLFSVLEALWIRPPPLVDTRRVCPPVSPGSVRGGLKQGNTE